MSCLSKDLVVFSNFPLFKIPKRKELNYSQRKIKITAINLSAVGRAV